MWCVLPSDDDFIRRWSFSGARAACERWHPGAEVFLRAMAWGISHCWKREGGSSEAEVSVMWFWSPRLLRPTSCIPLTYFHWPTSAHPLASSLTLDKKLLFQSRATLNLYFNHIKFYSGINGRHGGGGRSPKGWLCTLHHPALTDRLPFPVLPWGAHVQLLRVAGTCSFVQFKIVFLTLLIYLGIFAK